MTRTHERHLLVSVEFLDAEATKRAAAASAISEAISDALQRRLAKAESSSSSSSSTAAAAAAAAKAKAKSSGGQGQAAAAAAATLQVRHFSAHSGLCLVRTTLAESPSVRLAVADVRFVQTRPARLRVARAFGSATCARRELARRLEADEWTTATAGDAKASRALREQLAQLAEMQKR